MSKPCDGNHLWVSDGVVGPDEVETFTCTRCRAKGEECPTCDGIGEDCDEESAGDVWDCLTCQGTGVVEKTR